MGKDDGMAGGGEGVKLVGRPCEPAMKPGRDCREVEVVIGVESQGSSCRPEEPREEAGERPKESKEEVEVASCTLMELTSSFSCRRHLARRFWNHTWNNRKEDKVNFPFT